MNTVLMEELLHEEESTTLDFKREQYQFEKATDEQKGELLKDIIAFANAWRRTDAYVLIGVEEVKGGRSNVVGVENHFDDSRLQQFVNSKTNRPVAFLYETFSVEGKQVGIINISAQQEKPIYLVSNYGKLKQNEVYIRRGSMNDTAKPDEIARIGSVRLIEASSDSPNSPKINPIVEELRREQQNGSVVLVQIIFHRFDTRLLKCKVAEVNNLYAVFQQHEGHEKVSGSVSQITVSYEAAMNMKMFSIAPSLDRLEVWAAITCQHHTAQVHNSFSTIALLIAQTPAA